MDGADANGIVEISGNALAYEDGCNVRALDLGKGGWDRLDDGFIVGTSRVKKQFAWLADLEGKLAQETEAGKRQEDVDGAAG